MIVPNIVICAIGSQAKTKDTEANDEKNKRYGRATVIWGAVTHQQKVVEEDSRRFLKQRAKRTRGLPR